MKLYHISRYYDGNDNSCSGSGTIGYLATVAGACIKTGKTSSQQLTCVSNAGVAYETTTYQSSSVCSSASPSTTVDVGIGCMYNSKETEYNKSSCVVVGMPSTQPVILPSSAPVVAPEFSCAQVYHHGSIIVLYNIRSTADIDCVVID